MPLRLLFFVVLLPGFASAQFLPANTPLQQAFIQATQEDKLIFVMMESAGCLQCNDVADKGLQTESVQQQLKDHFVALSISPFHPDLNYIQEKYNYFGDGNAILFLDKWGTLVHRMNMSTTDSKKYVQEMAQALVRKDEADKVRSLEQAALTGSLDNDNLYALMVSRNLVYLPIDALLDKYVSQLPADSLKSVTAFQRIYRMCPILNSSADQVLRQNQPLFRLAWMSLPKTEQTAIQQKIIFKTRQQAIQEKQLAKALLAADYARTTVVTNIAGGDKAYQYNLMEYYKGIQDTASYLNACVVYYEKFLMKVDAARVKKMDSTWFANYTKNMVAHGDTLRDSQNKIIVKSKVSGSAVASRYNQDLNYGARSIYMMTNDIVYLKKALQWTAHASDFIESPYGLDTWARLLYKVDKNIEQAIQLEEKAISLSKERGFHTEAFNTVLTKMKKGLPNID